MKPRAISILRRMRGPRGLISGSRCRQEVSVLLYSLKFFGGHVTPCVNIVG